MTAAEGWPDDQGDRGDLDQPYDWATDFGLFPPLKVPNDELSACLEVLREYEETRQRYFDLNDPRGPLPDQETYERRVALAIELYNIGPMVTAAHYQILEHFGAL